MSLEESYYISQITASVAVVVSILYLALQTRQAVKSQHSAARQARTNRTVEIFLSQALEPSLADVCTRGFDGDESLSPAQLRQFLAYCATAFLSAEDAFLAHRSGTMDAETLTAIIQSNRLMLRNIGTRAAWERSRLGRHPDFVAFYDKLVAETPLDEPVDKSLRWREDLAAARTRAAC